MAEDGGLNVNAFVANKPIHTLDLLGLDIIVIYKPGLPGHGAILIGGDKRGGWDYYSFGPASAGAVKGWCKGKMDTGHYDNRDQADKDLRQKGYSYYVYFVRSADEDAKARREIAQNGPSRYHVTACNCVQFCDQALGAAGLIQAGETSPARHCERLKEYADKDGKL